MDQEQEALALVAISDRHPGYRLAALGKIEDAQLLSEIAQKSIGSNTRIRALEMLPESGYKEVRLQIVLNDPDPRVALKALVHVVDPSHLSEIVRNSQVPMIHALAAVKLGDIETLRRIATTSSDVEIALVAVGGLDQESLARIAPHITEKAVKRELVRRIDDESILARLALARENGAILEEVIGKLRSREILNALLNADCDLAVRAVVAQHMCDLFGQTCPDCGDHGSPSSVRRHCLRCGGRGRMLPDELQPPKVGIVCQSCNGHGGWGGLTEPFGQCAICWGSGVMKAEYGDNSIPAVVAERQPLVPKPRLECPVCRGSGREWRSALHGGGSTVCKTCGGR